MPNDIRPKLDTTLESNWFTAYVPRFPLLDRLVHAGETLWSYTKSAFAYLCGCKPQKASVLQELRPPGERDMYSLTMEEGFPIGKAKDLAQSQTVKLESHETREALPMLPVSEVENARKYQALARLSVAQFSLNTVDEFKNELLEDTQGEQLEDAFVNNSQDGHCLLPDSVKNSSLLNQGCPKDEGKVSKTHQNVLVDRKTGLGAIIYYDQAEKELIIAFSPPGSHRMSSLRTFGRAFLHWLGFVPKSFSQASKLVQEVQAHLKDLERSGHPVKLTLTGLCLGGATAEYAALRNKVPAVVFNPMHLGNGVRARIGQSRLDEAHKYLTEVVVQNDLTADTPWSWLYGPTRLIGMRSTGPVGTANRFLLPFYRKKRYAWNNPGTWDAFQAHLFRDGTFDTWLEHAEGMAHLQEKIAGLTPADLKVFDHQNSGARIEKMFVRKFGRNFNQAFHADLIRDLKMLSISIYNQQSPEKQKSAYMAAKESWENLSEDGRQALPARCRADLEKTFQSDDNFSIPAMCRRRFGPRYSPKDHGELNEALTELSELTYEQKPFSSQQAAYYKAKRLWRHMGKSTRRLLPPSLRGYMGSTFTAYSRYEFCYTYKERFGDNFKREMHDSLSNALISLENSVASGDQPEVQIKGYRRAKEAWKKLSEEARQALPEAFRTELEERFQHDGGLVMTKLFEDRFGPAYNPAFHARLMNKLSALGEHIVANDYPEVQVKAYGYAKEAWQELSEEARQAIPEFFREELAEQFKTDTDFTISSLYRRRFGSLAFETTIIPFRNTLVTLGTCICQNQGFEDTQSAYLKAKRAWNGLGDEVRKRLPESFQTELAERFRGDSEYDFKVQYLKKFGDGYDAALHGKLLDALVALNESTVIGTTMKELDDLGKRVKTCWKALSPDALSLIPKELSDEFDDMVASPPPTDEKTNSEEWVSQRSAGEMSEDEERKGDPGSNSRQASDT